jgi:type II secretory ATPase GspE/PulE/Tfp pilus assembly ATPase PilB-like protein
MGDQRLPLPLAERVTREFLVHHRVCPIAVRPDGALAVAVTEDSMLAALDDLGIAYDRPVVTESLPPAELDVLIARLVAADDADVGLEARGLSEESFAADARDLATQPPVVRYVNLLIRDAFEAGASDIHLEATRDGVRVRCRLDGVLQPAADPPAHLDRAVISRIKLLADLDIAERRRPQDGRVRVRLQGRELDLRVSTVPTIFGESVVLRLLDRGDRELALHDLGLPPGLLAAMQLLARRPHGLLLVTGPTGSGKTTTLYAALALRDASSEKIITIEDPVEVAWDRVTQVPVAAKTGVTFAAMLRSMLRQDPDVLLVGEMRDAETADLAIRAALTGHVVFSTLHTNDAIGAIPRLLDLGVPPYLIGATVEAVLAQRLVRRICEPCREPYLPDAVTLDRLAAEGEAMSGLTRGHGCAACRGTGYRGRTGVFELLRMTDDVRALLDARPSRAQLIERARASGMVSLRADGWAKVRAGITTVEEVLRVTES